MIINHNLGALNANRNMGINQANAGKSMEKLSSGLRINRAGDDAAGLAISEKMRGQIRGLDQASANSQDGISMIQTAEGALNETHSILQRMRELAVQAGNDTNTSTDRTEIQKEMNQLTSEINRIGNTTEFNTQKLLNGNKTGAAIATAVTAVIGHYTLAAATTGVLIQGIDGVNVTTVSATTVNGGASNLATAINANTTLAAKYTATTSGAIVKIAQKIASDTQLAVTSGLVATTVTAGIAAKDVRDGSATLQIGANQSQTFTVDVADMRAQALGLASVTAGTNFTTGTTNQLTDKSRAANEYALDISTATKATAAITTIDTAIGKVSSERSKLGAYQNRLEHTIANLGTSSENLTSAESRIRDVDMAKEMSTFSKNNILSQAAQAMLAQANQQPQQVLQLLR
ncbi:flagellin [Desulfitobacterium metallireducens]|uniref:Flagellin n=1 Tax=Desulfitobacterium metallireducens DSM 15288 TaxID=871968 RepID=W0EFG4_9FIRM|nr:flagellin [Desulfitobacterium metallireducens]AHF07806.1 flagellin [Desulfitobacterium metallireducens DSM 15288]